MFVTLTGIPSHAAWIERDKLTQARALTTPLLLLDLLLTAGMPWPTILYTVLLNEIMIVTGLVGALVQSSYKVRTLRTCASFACFSTLTSHQWGYFAFGCAAFLWVAFTVTVTARKYATSLGGDISRTYTICGIWTIALWFLYPIAWGLSEGGNVIAPDSEAVFYGILDIMAKPVFGALLLWGHRNIEPARLGVHIRSYEEDPAKVGGTHAAHHGEKGSQNVSDGGGAAPAPSTATV